MAPIILVKFMLTNYVLNVHYITIIILLIKNFVCGVENLNLIAYKEEMVFFCATFKWYALLIQNVYQIETVCK